MNRVYYRNDVRSSGVDGRALTATARKLMRAMGEEASSLSLRIVGDASMRMLNREYRKKDKTTDVLSFPQRDDRGASASRAAPAEDFLGDVVISAETARRQAADYNAPLQREMERLLIHGLLHLLGHDHHEAGERRRMEAEERRLAQSIGMPWPYERSRGR